MFLEYKVRQEGLQQAASYWRQQQREVASSRGRLADNSVKGHAEDLVPGVHPAQRSDEEEAEDWSQKDEMCVAARGRDAAAACTGCERADGLNADRWEVYGTKRRHVVVCVLFVLVGPRFGSQSSVSREGGVYRGHQGNTFEDGWR